jgi:hypothetical protein
VSDGSLFRTILATLPDVSVLFTLTQKEKEPECGMLERIFGPERKQQKAEENWHSEDLHNT